MLGWFNEEMVRASRSKRSLASALSARCRGRILMATLRSRRVSRARYTSPIPPAPSGAPISYGPSFVPEGSPMVALGLYSPSRDALAGYQSSSLTRFALFDGGEERLFDVRK